MKKLDLSNVNEAGTSNRLPAGGYVCRYTNVEDVPDREYLYMEFDIAEGEFAGYYKALEDRAGFWGGRCYRSYKETAKPMFKRMCSAVSKSNKGYTFDGGEVNCDEKTLIGKLTGIVLGEEEYIANNGEVKTRLYVAYECSVKTIREGDYKIPKPKELPKEEKATGNEDFMKVPEGEEDGVPW